MLDQPWISLKITIDYKQMHVKLVNGKAKEKDENKNASGIGINKCQEKIRTYYTLKNTSCLLPMMMRYLL